MRNSRKGIMWIIFDVMGVIFEVVDDRSRNLRPASGIGIKTIRFAREESNDDFSADFEISSFVELPQAIEKI